MTQKQIDELLDELDKLVYDVANDLAHIDNITEALLPNEFDVNGMPVDSGITSEQEERYMSLMDSLKKVIRTEFKYSIPELNKKE